MKKLSLLIALFMCLTIGGVYATWNYAGSNDIVDESKEITVSIPTAVVEGVNGTFNIEVNFELVVDDTNGDHKAELVFKTASDEVEPAITVTFTPSASATPDIKKNAVPAELYFTLPPSGMNYNMDADGNYSEEGNPTSIFDFGAYLSNTIFEENIEWTKYVNDVESDDVDAFANKFVYVLTGSDLTDTITLSQDFLLDTKVEHDMFSAALSGKSIVVHVTDGEKPAGSN